MVYAMPGIEEESKKRFPWDDQLTGGIEFNANTVR
jgi:hypothetical protein